MEELFELTELDHLIVYRDYINRIIDKKFKQRNFIINDINKQGYHISFQQVDGLKIKSEPVEIECEPLEINIILYTNQIRAQVSISDVNHEEVKFPSWIKKCDKHQSLKLEKARWEGSISKNWRYECNISHPIYLYYKMPKMTRGRALFIYLDLYTNCNKRSISLYNKRYVYYIYHNNYVDIAFEIDDNLNQQTNFFENGKVYQCFSRFSRFENHVWNSDQMGYLIECPLY